MSTMISQFIDNELELEAKPEFVKKIHGNRDFYEETLDYLDQELMLRGEVVSSVPDIAIPEPRPAKRFSLGFLRPVSFGLAGALAMAVVLFFSMAVPTDHAVTSHLNRFVIYRPDVNSVEITGSFTDWKRIALKPTGHSGYWEITLEIPDGVHRYTYILDGDQSFADPTILAQEHDDFGGINSILSTES